MIGDNAKRSIIDNSREKKWQKRPLVCVRSEPLQPGQNPMTDEDCLFTTGAYTIKYKPLPDSQYAYRPYVIKCDLFAGNRVRFANMKDLRMMAEHSHKVKWIIENTTLTSDMLGIAKRHPDMPIPFCLDIVKYCERLGRAKDISRFLWEVEEDGNA